jgi:hypothetical protein
LKKHSEPAKQGLSCSRQESRGSTRDLQQHCAVGDLYLSQRAFDADNSGRWHGDIVTAVTTVFADHSKQHFGAGIAASAVRFGAIRGAEAENRRAGCSRNDLHLKSK